MNETIITTTTMTERAFLTAVISANINGQITEYASNKIAKLDARNAARKSTLSPKQKENEEIKKQIINAIGDMWVCAADIGRKVNISTSKASALCGQLIKIGKLEAKEAKNPETKSNCKYYHVK